jgi:hypothetical protein
MSGLILIYQWAVGKERKGRTKRQARSLKGSRWAKRKGNDRRRAAVLQRDQ